MEKFDRVHARTAKDKRTLLLYVSLVINFAGHLFKNINHLSTHNNNLFEFHKF